MKALLILLFIFTLPAAWAQNSAFEGFVYDEQGEPIKDVMVSVLNMGHGYTMTDATGYFSLARVDPDDSLVVDHVAYGRIHVAAAGQKRMIIQLPRRQDRLLSFTLVDYSTRLDPPPPIRNMFGEIEKPGMVALRMPPSYLAGDLGLVQFLAKTMSYPAEAAKNDIQGMVEISFVVNENGDIRSPRITKSLGYGCDEEVMKAVLSMPRWHPGIQNGKTVPVPFTLPVWFVLKEKSSPSATSGSTETPPSDPVFILHGKIVQGKEIGDGLQGFGIKKLEAFKGKAATDQFGEQGQKGVILITPNTRD
ncbi:TonB family protein [Salmonirosea aquatica]|uniref:TonB family protein n=1 Tax=Salmonirosea aquatica TaxID=2654236 RepID=A0A7C9FC97_9BACT|nr:TonB family protein [Cytophagaceae bacterium SJW1-29]